MSRTTVTVAAAALLLTFASTAHAQVNPANIVSGTTQISLSGLSVPPTVLYTVPPGKTFVLTDFDYVFWSIAEPAFTSQMTLSDGSTDRWTWTAFVSASPPYEKAVERPFGTGIVFAAGSQVTLSQIVTSPASGADKCAVSWSGYLAP
jgi:hypothetical protein